MAVQSAGNKSPVSDIKADQSVPVSQNTHNKKNVLNQEFSKSVKPEPLVESPATTRFQNTSIDFLVFMT